MSEEKLLLFCIGNPEDDHLAVALIKPPAEDWMTAQVEVHSKGLSGSVAIEATISDILGFKEQLRSLYNSLRGYAEFQTLEGQITIHIEVDKLGHVKATGRLRSDFYTDNELRFDFRYDQTLLWHTIVEIDEALFSLSRDSA